MLDFRCWEKINFWHDLWMEESPLIDTNSYGFEKSNYKLKLVIFIDNNKLGTTIN